MSFSKSRNFNTIAHRASYAADLYPITFAQSVDIAFLDRLAYYFALRLDRYRANVDHRGLRVVNVLVLRTFGTTPARVVAQVPESRSSFSVVSPT